MHGRTLTALRALAVASLVALAACSTDDTPTNACTKNLDCKAGQLCRDSKCEDVPCGGACSDEEICDDGDCRVADGLDCATNPSICPRAFTCAPSGLCQRVCLTNRECTDHRFPACNPDGGFCGECAFNSDCTGTKKFCEPTSAACVGCVDASDCYVSGLAAGRYCDPAAHECKPGCHKGGDCEAGQRCQGGTPTVVGRCVECSVATQDTDCFSPKLRCEPTSLKCVECLGNEHCQSGECNTTTHTCVACVKNEKCPQGYICNQDNNECILGCAGGNGGSNCPAAFPSCDANRGARGTCVACLKDADCPRAQVCKVNGANNLPECVDGCTDMNTGAPIAARCAATAGEKNVLCSETLGNGRGKCVECEDDSRCTGSAPKCEPTTGLCRCNIQGDACTATASCGIRGANGVVDCNLVSSGAECLATVDCSSVSCGGQVRTLPTKRCGRRGAGGERCKGGTGINSCPPGLVPDFGQSIENVAANVPSNMKCVPDTVDCR